ncbi:MAG TPA: hypothetical protein ENI33_01135 [Thermoplasmatales archaeon]|nr:hypothetical protein [Thermoplasmatales archaeon]
MERRFILIIILLISFLGTHFLTFKNNAELNRNAYFSDLMCEWKVNNSNVKDIHPDFCWRYEGNQTAFQIMVASSIDNITSNFGDMWDSGKINDGKNFTEYKGFPLENNRIYYWKVKIWNESDVASYSYISTFKTNFTKLYSTYPHIRIFVVAYGSYNESEKEWMANHFDLSIGENLESYNPDVISLKYILYATMVSPSYKAEKLRDFCNETGCDYEDMFLHLNRDTNFTLPISNPQSDDWPVETRTVKGWDFANDWNSDGYVNDTEFSNLTNPNATARYRNESRVPIYYWNPSDNVMNVGNKYYQKFIANYSLEEAGDEDGFFVDTTARNIPVPSNAKQNIYEYADADDVDKEWNSDMQCLLAGVKRVLPDKIIIGNGWNSSNMVIEGVVRECWKNIDSPLSGRWDSFDDSTYGINGVLNLDKRGKIQLLQYNPVTTGNLSDERDLIFGLASYYLIHGNYTYFGVGKHPYSGIHWFDALSFDIGKPLSSIYIFNSSFEIIPENNLINNGGFEIDNGTDFDLNRTDDNDIPNDLNPDGWIPYEPVEMVSDVKHSGNFSVMINTDNYYNNNINKQYLNLKNNTTYTLRAWIKTENVTRNGAQVYAYEFDNATSCFIIQKGIKDWSFYSKMFNVSNDTYGRINYRIFGNGTAWFDDISLIEGEFYDCKIFAREYEKALILVKPKLSIFSPNENETFSTHELDGVYFPLHANGTIGKGINKISLRYGEANILLKPNLFKGWNLMTLPVENNYTASSLYSSIQNCSIILKWNSSNQDFIIYVPGSPYDFEIENGHGYFIGIKNDSIFYPRGDEIIDVSVLLCEGWNCLGWFKENETTARSIYENITSCSIVLSWNVSLQDFNLYVPGSPYDFAIKQGDGFLVAVNQQSIWHGEG